MPIVSSCTISLISPYAIYFNNFKLKKKSTSNINIRFCVDGETDPRQFSSPDAGARTVQLWVVLPTPRERLQIVIFPSTSVVHHHLLKQVTRKKTI